MTTTAGGDTTRARVLNRPTRGRGGGIRRIASLARGEALLLRRNPMALFIAIAVPISLVLFVHRGQPTGDSRGLAGGDGIVISLVAFALLSVLYYNLVTALVARREELVLKRLRTGETADIEILAGTAAPCVAVAWIQIALGFAAAFTVLGSSMPVNPGLVLVAVVLGTVTFVLLAAATTVLTPNVEMAQLTTTPLLLVSLLSSGLMFPPDGLPEHLQLAARGMPVTALVDLLRLGLSGTEPDGSTVDLAGSFGSAVVPVLVLIGWVLVGAWATRRWFRWEPRR